MQDAHMPQNRVGSKFGGGGVAGASETNVDRRERLRKLALETIDLAKVSIPYSLAASWHIDRLVRTRISCAIISAHWNVVSA